MLLNFQTMVSDLTGLPVAGASLLDEATAAAEAMTMGRRGTGKGPIFLVDEDWLPQTIGVLETRAEPLGISLVVAAITPEIIAAQPDGELFGVLLQYPGASGAVRDLTPLTAAATARGALTAVAADLLAATPLRPPCLCPWAAGTPPTSRSGTSCAASCPAGSSASPWTPTASPPTGWPCRPASSTSAGRRPPATSAPPRSCRP